MSSLLLCTSTMLQLGLPHVNIMSKFDEMVKFKDLLDFNIDFYTDVLDLRYLLEKLDEDPLTSKFVFFSQCNSIKIELQFMHEFHLLLYRYKKLNAALVSLVEDYSLVNFLPLDVKNKALLMQVKNAIDKANGYIFGGNEPKDVQALLACAMGAVSETEKMNTLDSYM